MFERDPATRFFALEFFYELSSPKPLIESFKFFSQIRGDIHKARCTTGVNDTGGYIFHEIYIDHHVVDKGNPNNDNNISLNSPQTEDEENK
jgi:hypothetical protein